MPFLKTPSCPTLNLHAGPLSARRQARDQQLGAHCLHPCPLLQQAGQWRGAEGGHALMVRARVLQGAAFRQLDWIEGGDTIVVALPALN